MRASRPALAESLLDEAVLPHSGQAYLMRFSMLLLGLVLLVLMFRLPYTRTREEEYVTPAELESGRLQLRPSVFRQPRPRPIASTNFRSLPFAYSPGSGLSMTRSAAAAAGGRSTDALRQDQVMLPPVGTATVHDPDQVATSEAEAWLARYRAGSDSAGEDLADNLAPWQRISRLGSDQDVSFSEAKERLDRLRKRFAAADLSGEGVLDREELRGLLECSDTFCPTKHWLPDSVIDAVMARYDHDKNGVICFSEFLDLARDKVLLDGKLDEFELAFRSVAKGKDTISQPQLKLLFDGLGDSKSDSELKEIMAQYDFDGNGLIDFGEFLEMARTHTVELQSMVDYVTMPSIVAPVAPIPHVEPTPRPLDTPLITDVATPAEFREILEAESPGLVVLEVTFSWCRPCKLFAPKYQRLAKEYAKPRFVKMVGNLNLETKAYVREELNIQQSPAFYAFRPSPDKPGEHTLVAQWTGNDVSRFRENLDASLAEWELP